MPTLGVHDRPRIERDIEQAQELIERYQAEYEKASGPQREDLETEIALLELRVDSLKELLK